MKITPFHPSHIGALKPAHRFRDLLARVTPEYLAGLAAEPSITVWCENIPVACGGILGQCEVWAVLDEQRGRRHKFALVRAARDFLKAYPFAYMNCEVPIDCKLPVKLLGFVTRGHQDRGERCYIHLERVV
jgi:hypothetical protein